MVNKCMQLFIILLSFSLLGAVALSFLTAKITSSEPLKNRLTGYPIWLGEIKGFDPDRNDAMGFLSIVISILAGIIGLKAIRNPPTSPKLTTHIYALSDDSDNDPAGLSAYGLNSVIILYVWITIVALIGSMLVDVGKVWSVVGALHNVAEIIILVLLGGGGKIRNSTFYAWILFYIWSVVAICIFVDFPGDAIFFKFQGLCMDFALVIEFTRIYITTKEHIRDGRNTLPLIDDENDDDYIDAHKNCPIWPATINFPNNLWLLIAASVFHIGGNVVDTFYGSYIEIQLLFEFTYAISFPLYAYYVYLDTNAASVLPQKRIYLPYTPTWKVIVITVISITLSALTLRIALTLN